MDGLRQPQQKDELSEVLHNTVQNGHTGIISVQNVFGDIFVTSIRVVLCSFFYNLISTRNNCIERN